jgi:hypothetical protein
MSEKVSPMERRTLAALDSANPFQTPVSAPRSLGGKPVASTPDPEPDEIDRLPEAEDEMIDVAVEDKAPAKRRGRPKKAEQASPVAEAEPVSSADTITQTHDRNGMPNYRCEFAGRDIFVGKCWHKTVSPATADAVSAMMLDFGKDRIRTDTIVGDSNIYRSRNLMVERFMATDAKWLFFLDDDIVPAIGRAEWFRSWVPSASTVPTNALQRHVLHRLIGAGKTLVGAAYFQHGGLGRIACSDLSLEPAARSHADRIAPVDWVGTGALMVHRKVFEDIREAFPELHSTASSPFNYFGPISHAKGEDISFCERAKKAGHQCHIDLGIPVKHS